MGILRSTDRPRILGGQDRPRVLGARGGIPDSAVNRWKFDESQGDTLTDSIGDLDGSLVGGTWTDDAQAVGGYKIALDGVDDYIDFDAVPAEISDATNSFSVAITIEDIGSIDTQTTIWSWFSSSTSEEFTLGIDDSDHAGIGASIGDNEVTSAGVAKSNLPSGKVRLVGVFANGSVSFYANKSSYTGSFNAVSVASNDGTMRIGGLQDRTSSSFLVDTNMDNPIIYGDALDETGVKEDFNAQPWS